MNIYAHYAVISSSFCLWFYSISVEGVVVTVDRLKADLSLSFPGHPSLFFLKFYYISMYAQFL